MATCKRCSQEIVWPQPYVKGQPPLEPDGKTPHDCPAWNKETGSAKSQSYSSDSGSSGQILTELQTINSRLALLEAYIRSKPADTNIDGPSMKKLERIEMLLEQSLEGE